MPLNDTTSILTDLCATITAARYRQLNGKSDETGTALCEKLEDIVISSLVTMKGPLDDELLKAVFQSGVSEMVAVLPHTTSARPLQMMMISELIDKTEPEYFALAHTRGMPLDPFIRSMLKRTAQSEEWRRTMIEDIAPTAPYADALLDYDLLGDGNVSRDIIPDLVRIQIDRYSRHVNHYAQRRLAAGRVYPAALLLIMGVDPSDIDPQNANSAIGRKFLEAVGSNHGRLALQAAAGSPQNFLRNPKACLRSVASIKDLNFAL
jgi:hypothetical protein